MDNELMDIMPNMELHYFDIGTSSTPDIQLGGYGFTQMDENSNPEESEKQYINQATKTTKVTGFSDEFPITADMIKNEPVVEHFYEIFRDRKRGTDAQVIHYIVETWNPIEESGTPVANTYKCRKQTQSVIITGKTGTPGENMQFTGSLKSVSDFVDGTFNVSTKAFTPTI